VRYKPTVTEPEGPRPASPTPEEISARLEALLKRTHQLRAQQSPVLSSGPLSVTWPPPDRELDRYDVVDVAAASAPPAQTRPVPPAEPAAAEFARPDWSELRLRAGSDDVSRRAGWAPLLIAILALASVTEGAYIWYLQSIRPASEQGRVRLDAPTGAEVLIDGQSVGTAPIEHALDPGEYDIEIVQGDRRVRVDQVIVGIGRTVMLLVPEGASPARTATATTPGASAQPAAGAASTSQAAPSQAAVALGGGLVSETTGAVSIESTPTGLPVTMGGRPRGVTPITLGLIKPGRHDVLVGGAARQVDIQAGQVSTLRVAR
jgi:hypothetical protein